MNLWIKTILFYTTKQRIETFILIFKRNITHVFDVLLWNEDGELTEFTNGNIVLEIDGTLWTPPIDSGLLAGTYRERLIKGKHSRKSINDYRLKKKPESLVY